MVQERRALVRALRHREVSIGVQQHEAHVPAVELSLLLARARPRRAVLILAAIAVAALVAAASAPQIVGSQVADALAGLAHADPRWLWLAACGYVAALTCVAQAWRSTLARCGASSSRVDVTSRYAIGCLLSALLPAHVGGAVRIALLAQTVPGDDRLWKTGGASGVVGALRALMLMVLAALAAALGALPWWPLLVLGAIVALAAAVCAASRGLRGGTRLAHALAAFHALARSPLDAARILAWVCAATLCRVTAAFAVLVALDVPSPAVAALLIVPALDLAALVPLTPGNVGVSGGAVAMALHSRGLDLATGLSAGLALSAVETAAGVACGALGVAALTRLPSPAFRRRIAAIAAGTACCAAAAFLGAVLLGNVV